MHVKINVQNLNNKGWKRKAAVKGKHRYGKMLWSVVVLFRKPNQTFPSSKMVAAKSCWTPCFWHNNIVDGTVAISIYTFLMSICIITYSGYVINGGDSSQLWLPFFETNLNSTTVPVAIFIIFYFSVLMLASGLLVVRILIAAKCHNPDQL